MGDCGRLGRKAWPGILLCLIALFALGFAAASERGAAQTASGALVVKKLTNTGDTSPSFTFTRFSAAGCSSGALTFTLHHQEEALTCVVRGTGIVLEALDGMDRVLVAETYSRPPR